MAVLNSCSNRYFESNYEAFQKAYRRVVAANGETRSPRENYGSYFLQRSASQDGWERYFYSNDRSNWTKVLLSKWVTIHGKKYKIQATEEGVASYGWFQTDWFFVVTFRLRDADNNTLATLSSRERPVLKARELDEGLRLLLSGLEVFQ